MKRTVQVHLGDDARHIGTLYFDAVGSRQRSAFSYEGSWLTDRELDQFADAFEHPEREAVRQAMS